jgi:hypothetical protein
MSTALTSGGPRASVGEDPGDDCALKITGDLHLAWDLLESAAARRAVGRERLVLFRYMGAKDEPTKFKVYDVDGDRRSEATVIVSVHSPFVPDLEETYGQVGFVVDTSDLHVQFSATRRYVYSFQDVSASTEEAETVWLARDVDGDGHADLQVRETIRSAFSPGEADEGASARDSKTKKIVCPYDQAADVWRCPEALGQQLLARPKPPAPAVTGATG